MNRIILMMLVAFSACTYDGGKFAAGQVWDCKDFRDGETFVMHSENLDNYRPGIGTDSCVTGRDDTGKQRSLCESNQQFLKCTKRMAQLPSLKQQPWNDK